MIEENQITENLCKLEIKRVRKERKLLKKALKREERQKEYDKKQMILKLGQRDQRVTIITKDIANTLEPKKNYSNPNWDLNSKDDNFPALNGTIIKSNQKQIVTNSVLYEPSSSKQDVSTKQNKTSFAINLMEILTMPKVEIAKRPVSNEQIVKYSGNSLDSSKPKRYKGKHREISKLKPPSKLKSEIIADMKQSDNTIYNYCDNIITDELNTNITEFLNHIVRYQEKLYKKDPIKGTAKRRYVTGFREVKKYLLVNKIKLLIFAPNIKNIVENGALDKLIHELISIANENNIPYVFALSRRKIGQILLKNVPICCIGIFYYDGVEQLFNNILELLEKLKKNKYN